MDQNLKTYFSQIGSKGGKKSKRKLSSEDARNMVILREARKAYRDYYASCFWSYDPNLIVSINDVHWVAEQLQKYGDLTAWKKSKKLCP
jgi:hypothetical protein